MGPEGKDDGQPRAQSIGAVHGRRGGEGVGDGERAPAHLHSNTINDSDIGPCHTSLSVGLCWKSHPWG